MAELTEEEVKKAAQENIEKIAKTAAEKTAEEKAAEAVEKTLKEKAFITRDEADKAAEEAVKKALEDKKAEDDKRFDTLSAQIKKASQIEPEEKVEKSFNEYLAEAIEENKEAIQGFKKGSTELTIALKAVGDMSIANNFPGATPWIQDVRTGLIVNPYNRVWLSDIIPGGTSSGNSILYPKENGGEGAVGLWTDKTVDKPQVDYDLTSQAAFFKWIAGYVIIEREMLDDIAWLQSYLQAKLLISYKTAENNFILNGSTDANPVTGMLAAATAYNGIFENPVDRVIDAGWGQIVEDTQEFYQPTHTILNPRAAVSLGLNKADGSGEYDLPNGSVAFSNGRLSIGGLDVVTTTGIAATDFLTFDRNALSYVTRLAPELRMFEDAALAKRNKVMFRIEGRATLAIFNDNALVTGPLAAPAP
ncbi:HK97 family phage major capsid protein [Sphingobacterium allocomposti]|uniref:HK97 family phage major capsid protein n=1 Tax=Sphingobacterium allocomposti TaxID=415956 RepID=A0A5S5D2D3_9SPHI|nr:phage major capsid protein [Sphingobacterium composti Yoo et al. 2007 non Ten et al. 2007]TYP89418.1 HK97 family phage major capsid protein [Sphingobacterium composti Yoo et al. 2007 non Ten et al. 2007]